MRKLAVLLAFVLGIGFAVAIEFPSAGSITLFDSDGRVVGHVELDGDEIEGDVLRGFDGLVTARLSDAAGNVTEFEGMVSAADGSLIFIDPDTFDFVDLRDVARDSGREIDLSFDEDNITGAQAGQENLRGDDDRGDDRDGGLSRDDDLDDDDGRLGDDRDDRDDRFDDDRDDRDDDRDDRDDERDDDDDDRGEDRDGDDDDDDDYDYD